MHVLLTQGTKAGRWHVEVVGNDPETATEVVQVRFDLNGVSETATRTGLYAKAQWLLLHNGFHTTGSWQEHGGIHRAPTAPNLKATTYAVLSPDGYADMGLTVEEIAPSGGKTTKLREGLLFNRNRPHTELYALATAHLAKHGWGIVGSWYETDMSGFHRAEVAPQASRPSEADEMIATSEALALSAMRELDQLETTIVAHGNRDPKKHHGYMRGLAALDAHCEQLAQMEWTRKIYAAKGAPLSGHPSFTAEVKKRLRAVIDAEKQMQGYQAQSRQYLDMQKEN